MDFSAGYLLTSLVVSSIGLGVFIYGKKQVRMPQLVIGLTLMLFPYVVTEPVTMGSVAAVLLLTLLFVVRFLGW